VGSSLDGPGHGDDVDFSVDCCSDSLEVRFSECVGKEG
jgi:hypothetical protein